MNPEPPPMRSTTIGIPQSRFGGSEPNLLDANSSFSGSPEKWIRGLTPVDDRQPDTAKVMKSVGSFPELDQISPKQTDFSGGGRAFSELPPVPNKTGEKRGGPLPAVPGNNADSHSICYESPKQNYYQQHGAVNNTCHKKPDLSGDSSLYNTPPTQYEQSTGVMHPKPPPRGSQPIESCYNIPSKPCGSRNNFYDMPPQSRHHEDEGSDGGDYDMPPQQMQYIDDGPKKPPRKPNMNYNKLPQSEELYNSPARHSNEDMYNMPSEKSRDSEGDVYNIPPQQSDSRSSHGNNSDDSTYNLPTGRLSLNEVYDLPKSKVAADDFYDIPPGKGGMVSKVEKFSNMQIESTILHRSQAPGKSSAYTDDFYDVPPGKGGMVGEVELCSAMQNSADLHRSQASCTTSTYVADQTYDVPPVSESKKLRPKISVKPSISVPPSKTQTTKDAKKDEIFYNVAPSSKPAAKNTNVVTSKEPMISSSTAYNPGVTADHSTADAEIANSRAGIIHGVIVDDENLAFLQGETNINAQIPTDMPPNDHLQKKKKSCKYEDDNMFQYVT